MNAENNRLQASLASLLSRDLQMLNLGQQKRHSRIAVNVLIEHNWELAEEVCPISIARPHTLRDIKDVKQILRQNF